jgi:hypothetical protein
MPLAGLPDGQPPKCASQHQKQHVDASEITNSPQHGGDERENRMVLSKRIERTRITHQPPTYYYKHPKLESNYQKGRPKNPTLSDLTKHNGAAKRLGKAHWRFSKSSFSALLGNNILTVTVIAKFLAPIHYDFFRQALNLNRILKICFCCELLIHFYHERIKEIAFFYATFLNVAIFPSVFHRSMFFFCMEMLGTICQVVANLRYRLVFQTFAVQPIWNVFRSNKKIKCYSHVLRMGLEIFKLPAQFLIQVLCCFELKKSVFHNSSPLLPNAKRSHAGPTTPSTPQDGLPALAAAIR